MKSPVLEIKNLSKRFVTRRYLWNRQAVYAVNHVSFAIDEGSIFGLVGESGCGKTTVARCLMRLEHPTEGEIWFQGKEVGRLPEKEFRPYREKLQMIFQDPSDSLNPRFSVRQTLMEPLILRSTLSRSEKQELLEETMEIVGLRPEHLSRFSHQLSTGQQQRVGIARATICNPDFVVLDEPTSALDLSFRGRVLEMLLDLQKRFGITYLFISHDLGIVRYFCQQTAVMYLGFIVETGITKDLFQNPVHPYTEALISAIPKIDPKTRKERILLKGEIPSPINVPAGCPFSNRCPEAISICFERRPRLLPASDGRLIACHIANNGNEH